MRPNQFNSLKSILTCLKMKSNLHWACLENTHQFLRMNKKPIPWAFKRNYP